MAAFAYIIDTARVNSQTLYSIQNQIDPRKNNSFKFGWELVKELVTPQVEHRKMTSTTIHHATKRKIELILNVPHDEPHPADQLPFPSTSQVKKRCQTCTDDIRGDPEFRIKHNKLSKNKMQCQKCGNGMCKE
jgi:hypothetical protein